jgi:glycosyltransferase involved in cell wall biosynthesis
MKSRQLDLQWQILQQARNDSNKDLNVMKVLHVITSLDPALGGPPAVATRLAAAMAAEKHHAAIISYAPDRFEMAIRDSLAAVPGAATVRLISVGANSRLERFTGRRAGGIIRKVLQNYDICHIHGVWDPIALAAASACRSAGRPYVIMPHGMLDPWSLSQRPLKKRLALTLGYRRMLSKAAFLHVLNEDEKTLIAPLRLKTLSRVIPNGVFLEEIDPPPPTGSFRNIYPELGDSPYILFLSRLHFKKGLDFLASAFAGVHVKMPSVRLVVAGPDDGERVSFENAVKQLGIGSHVHVVGPLYGRDKFAAIVDAAVFCLPSRQEGFSIAITEAMAVGCPVVISENCHFPEVEHTGAGLIYPLNAASVESAILQVLNNPDEGERMRRAGRELVRARFTWQAVTKQLVDAYQTVLDNRRT